MRGLTGSVITAGIAPTVIGENELFCSAPHSIT
jgi:hypothetical protein